MRIKIGVEIDYLTAGVGFNVEIYENRLRRKKRTENLLLGETKKNIIRSIGYVGVTEKQRNLHEILSYEYV